MRFIILFSLVSISANFCYAKVESFAHQGKVLSFDEKTVVVDYNKKKLRIDRKQFGKNKKLKIDEMVTWAPADK